MARIRSIKPEFPQSETVGKLSRDARLLFVQLWTIVDDEGRARASSRMLASLLYPYDDDAPSLIDGWMGELERHGCVRLYAVDGSHFLDVPNWLKHQKIDRPSPSRLPDYREPSTDTREPSRILAADLGPRTLDQDLGEDQRSLRSLNARAENRFDLEIPESLKRPNEADYRREFDGKFWQAYPHKVGKPAAFRAFIKARKAHSIDAILFGLDRYANDKPADRAWLNPATFLNQERFNDEPAAVAVQRSRNGLDALGSALAAVAEQIDQSEETDREVKRISSPH